MFPKILAIIPCHNESASIGALLKEFRHLNFAIDILVIDDGSTDDSYTIASQNDMVIRLNQNQGTAIAVKEGIKYAFMQGHDYCIQIDGDGQHIPSEITKFINALKYDSANIYVGSRYVGNFLSINGSILRRCVGLLVSFVIVFLFGKWLCDPLSGMRLMDRESMNLFLSDSSYTLDAEVIPLALRNRLVVREVPVTMRKRIYGTSYVSGFKGITFLTKLLWRTLQIRFCSSRLARR